MSLEARDFYFVLYFELSTLEPLPRWRVPGVFRVKLCVLLFDIAYYEEPFDVINVFDCAPPNYAWTAYVA